MIRTAWLFSYTTGALLALGVAIVLPAGCDSGSKRESLYRRLVGTWNVQRVYLDGNQIDYSEQRVQFEFSPQDDDSRSYRLIRIVRDDTSAVSGPVGVPGNNLLQMTGDLSLVWRFTFEKPDDLSDSVQFRLESASDESVQALLNAIGLSGGARSLTIDLVRESG